MTIMQEEDDKTHNIAQICKTEMNESVKLPKGNGKVHDCAYFCFFGDGAVHYFRLFYQD